MKNEIKEIMKTFDHLEQRWADEQEYEDWNEYIVFMTKAVEKHSLTFISLVSEPAFKLTFKDNEKTYMLVCKKQQIELVEAK